MYDGFVAAAERAIEVTSTPDAPWTIIEGEDDRYRASRSPPSFEMRCANDSRRRSVHRGGCRARRPQSRPHRAQRCCRGLNMFGRSIARSIGRNWKRARGGSTSCSGKRAGKASRPSCVFEGSDAAGKGGAIRRITAALDAPAYQTIQSPRRPTKSAPSLSLAVLAASSAGGMLSIFDRSWYGRVLVERVEGFASPGEWFRGVFRDQPISRTN